MSVFLSRETVYKGNYTIDKRNPDKETYPYLHYHDFYEVQIYTEGFRRLSVGGKEFSVSCGDIALINLFEPHHFFMDPSINYIRYCICLESSFLLSICSESSNLLSIFCSNNRNYPVFHVNERSFEKYLSVLSRFEQIELSHGRDILERSLLFELLAYLYNECYDGNGQNSTDINNIATITKLVRYVNDHISENLSIEVLSNVSNFSAFYLCRMFKKHTGYTLNTYILTKRIETAKYLLRENIPISEISKQVGFRNYSSFYKAFLNSCKISPREYRYANKS